MDIPKHHHYFEGQTIRILRDQLSDDAILRVWTEGPQMYLLVERPESGAAKIHFQPLNDSHVCPGSPGCPN